MSSVEIYRISHNLKIKMSQKLLFFLQAHSSVEKAGLIGLVKVRYIESDENLSLRGDKLKEAINIDRENGLVPLIVSILD